MTKQFVVVAMAILVLGAPLLDAGIKKGRPQKFRMVWQGNATALRRYSPWLDFETVRFQTEQARRRNASVERWIEEKRKLLFIPLPPRRIMVPIGN